jgi:hypothetical protein
MHELRIAFPFGVKIDTFGRIGSVFFKTFGFAAVRCWPNVFVELDELAPEITVDHDDIKLAFELPERDASKFLSSDQSTVFAVRSCAAWTKVLLSSARHSEFSAILIPLNIDQETMKKVFFHAERFTYTKSLADIPQEADWIVSVGLVNDQHEAILVFCRHFHFVQKLKIELPTCADLIVS